ncbi:glyoxylase I 4 isoform X2 [Rhododendron vialii]|uniref:glyoxylase I 4 isoform X2 n=1 Tax=Rhododendron vialii TaxID=182163 RepID=UPI00265EFCE2|nr:glyoxylase I 4 isoform X2 [Rhododendron vialii]
MAALLSPSLSLHPQNKVHPVGVSTIFANTPSTRNFLPVVRTGRSHGYHRLIKAKTSAEVDVLAKDSISVESADYANDYGLVSMHHVGILCENLERSLEFYQNVLGLKINEARPDDKLPYRGAWLWVGSEMIHLMELPNPDPLTGRPAHGGRDRHTCIEIRDVSKLKAILDKAGIPYTLSRSGRPAIFFRDPDTNALEFAQFDA